MISRKAQILIVAGDPGGAQFLLPVVESLLQDTAFRLHLFPYHAALNIFSQSLEDGHTLLSFGDDHQMRDYISQHAIDLVITATSVNELNWEVRCINAANQLGIPSIAAVDFWNNYELRFRDAQSDLIQPTIVAVVDGAMSKAIGQSDIKAVRTKIVGSPRYEQLFNQYGDLGGIQKSKGVTDWRILFVSQHIAHYYREMEQDELFLGYSETIAFEHLIKASQHLADDKGINVTMQVLLHPKGLDEVDIQAYQNVPNVSVSVLSNDQRYQQLANTDLVIGMYSNFLIEASLLGVPVCLYQPDRQFIPYTESPLAELKLVTSYDELLQTQLFFMQTGSLSSSGLKHIGLKATDNMIDIVTLLLKNK